MEKDFGEFVAKRCADALSDNDEYREVIGREHEAVEELETTARVCYTKGFSDAIKLLVCSQKM